MVYNVYLFTNNTIYLTIFRREFSALDVSADLRELGRTPIAVVSAGVKSILDIPKTLEYLVSSYFRIHDV